ncbi:hypothetical protein, partial [Pseudomonas sp. MSSRFD41]|uniref:hypothetical protein n=1 Tax=Pseudomonas sp. MSSRFD41 TaxID=1310370 RepID=UPI001C8CE61A
TSLHFTSLHFTIVVGRSLPLQSLIARLISQSHYFIRRTHRPRSPYPEAVEVGELRASRGRNARLNYAGS